MKKHLKVPLFVSQMLDLGIYLNPPEIYLLLHNKLPVAERLFRIGFKNDPYCLNCPQAVKADVEHFLCQCERSKAG